MSTKGFGGYIDRKSHSEDAGSPLLLVVTQESPLLLHANPDSRLLNESAHMRVSQGQIMEKSKAAYNFFRQPYSSSLFD